MPEGPNIAVLLSLGEKSVALEKGEDFELWSGLADKILEAEMCAWVQTFAADDDDASRALGKQRAAAAERWLLRKGFTRERLMVEPNADPSELVQRGMDADVLRDGVLLSPRERNACQ